MDNDDEAPSVTNLPVSQWANMPRGEVEMLERAVTLIKELEAQHEADCATMAKKSVEWARSLAQRIIFDVGTVHCLQVSRNPYRADWLEVRKAHVERVAQMILEEMKNG
jgi:hypothetical protein